ncbi:hypothetical protein LCGC14_2689830, partial [marine sediment metagenome]
TVKAKITKELKTTKPLKKGQRRVGKFDPESNRVFDAMRGFNKLSREQAQAEFDAFPAEGNTEAELIKKRFLSLKANEQAASADIFNAVLKDIQRMKEIGKKAKDEADFNRRLERQERVDELLTAGEKVKADKKAIVTKIINVYRKGFSNIHSMLNSTFGLAMAEKHDPEISENRRDTAVFFVTKKLSNGVERIYKEKNVQKVFEEMAKSKHELVDFEGLKTEITKLEILDIFNSIKNKRVKQRYEDSYGLDQIQNLLGELTPSDMALADLLQETVQGYRQVLNQRHIETTGRDLGFVENYWPATSEHKDNVFDDIRIQGETPSALKERAKGRVIPIPTAGKAGIKTLFQDMKYLINEWGDDEDTADFNRLVVIFFFMSISISALNYHFNMDSMNPGMFLTLLTFFIVMGSIVGGTNPTSTSHGLFYYNNLTTSAFVNK